MSSLIANAKRAMEAGRGVNLEATDTHQRVFDMRGNVGGSIGTRGQPGAGSMAGASAGLDSSLRDSSIDSGQVAVDYASRMHSRIPEIREDAMKDFRKEFHHAPEDHYDRLEANEWLAHLMADDLREEMLRDTRAAYESTETAMGKSSIDDARTDSEREDSRELQGGAGRRARRNAGHYKSSAE